MQHYEHTLGVWAVAPSTCEVVATQTGNPPEVGSTAKQAAAACLGLHSITTGAA